MKLVLYIPDLADPFLVKRFTELIEQDKNSTNDLQYGLMIATILVVKRFLTQCVKTQLHFMMNRMG
jgi:hypothetical protein